MNADGLEFDRVEVGGRQWTGIPMVRSGPDAYPDSFRRLDTEPGGPGGPAFTDPTQVMFVSRDVDAGVAVWSRSVVARGADLEPAIEFVEMGGHHAGSDEGGCTDPDAAMSITAELSDGPSQPQHHDETLTAARELSGTLSEFGLGPEHGWVRAAQPGTEGVGAVEMEFDGEEPTVTLAGRIPTDLFDDADVTVYNEEERALHLGPSSRLETPVVGGDGLVGADDCRLRARTERATVERDDAVVSVAAGYSDQFRPDDRLRLAPFERSGGEVHHSGMTVWLNKLADASGPDKWLEDASQSRATGRRVRLPSSARVELAGNGLDGTGHDP